MSFVVVRCPARSVSVSSTRFAASFTKPVDRLPVLTCTTPVSVTASSCGSRRAGTGGAARAAPLGPGRGGRPPPRGAAGPGPGVVVGAAGGGEAGRVQATRDRVEEAVGTDLGQRDRRNSRAIGDVAQALCLVG